MQIPATGANRAKSGRIWRLTNIRFMQTASFTRRFISWCKDVNGIPLLASTSWLAKAREPWLRAACSISKSCLLPQVLAAGMSKIEVDSHESSRVAPASN